MLSVASFSLTVARGIVASDAYHLTREIWVIGSRWIAHAHDRLLTSASARFITRSEGVQIARCSWKCMLRYVWDDFEWWN